MIQFTPDFLDIFLAVVRKYMQLRGVATQKDLAELTQTGISTMSRFLNLKTSTVDEQVVAKIIAALDIPLHEIIDGVEEESTDTLKKLVLFYKDELNAPNDHSTSKASATISVGGRKHQLPFGENVTGQRRTDLTIREKMETLSPRQKAYLNDFLNLDINDRDLIVDLGDAIFRYFRQRNVEF
ncbi:MAG TPA: helix-turn-helix transcriptional regulator [Bacteriovoracaceae bacterium]|nr:helix-turn-helix transcriptional regulator [Bacteriovoracaceae bacterium]